MFSIIRYIQEQEEKSLSPAEKYQKSQYEFLNTPDSDEEAKQKAWEKMQEIGKTWRSSFWSSDKPKENKQTTSPPKENK